MNEEINCLLQLVENQTRRDDARRLLALIEEASGYPPHIEGNMIGYGRYHYKYASGREGDWFVTGFSPRKQNLTIYIMPGFSEYGELLAVLGKHKTAKSCLYINKLADVDLSVLRTLISQSVRQMQQKYHCSGHKA